MATLFTSGLIADVILIILVLEVAGIVLYARVYADKVLLQKIIFTLFSGICFALALRFAITEAWWGWMALALTGAGLAHMIDLIRCLQEK